MREVKRERRRRCKSERISVGVTACVHTHARVLVYECIRASLSANLSVCLSGCLDVCVNVMDGDSVCLCELERECVCDCMGKCRVAVRVSKSTSE